MNYNLKIKPYPYQKEGISYGLKHKRVLIGDECGLGKAQSLDSIIWTPTGSVRMADVHVGQAIFGADGGVYHIQGIFPQGIKSVYSVEFNDGSSCECTMDHLWCVRTSARRLGGQGWCTKTLRELVDKGIKYKNSNIVKWEISDVPWLPFQR